MKSALPFEKFPLPEILLGAMLAAGAALAAGDVLRSGDLLSAEWALAALGALGLAGGLAAGWWLVERPKAILAGMVFVPALASDFFAERALGLGVGKLYVQDCFFLLFFAWAAKRWLESPPGTPFVRGKMPLLWPLGLWAAMGALQTARAVATLGVDFNDALGDFRRGYFYPLAMLFPLLIPDRARTCRFLEKLLLLTAAALVLKGLGQGALGKIDRRMQTDAAHILNHFGAVAVSFLAFYCLARLAEGRAKTPGQAALAMGGLAVASLTVLLANFRAGWLGFGLGGLVVFSTLPWRAKAAMLWLGAAGALLAGGLLFAAWDFQVGTRGQTVGSELARKVERTIHFDRDINVLWRYQSYEAALDSWRERPWLGAGPGAKNTFYFIRSDGSLAMASRHRVHNSYLWALQTVGIAGAAFFLLLHGTFFVRLWRGARRLSREGSARAPLAVGLMGDYVAFMAATGFDPLLEEGIPAVWLASLMGAALLTLPSAADQP